MANQYRGKGSSAYQRQQQAIKRLCKAKGIGCSNCGQPFDYADHNSPRGFTADHPVALANGGTLLGQRLIPLCRSCNARKGAVDTELIVLRPPS